MYILAKKIDQSILEIIGPNNNESNETEIINMAAVKYGNSVTDYTVYRVLNDSKIQRRISAGEKFDLVWNGDFSQIIDIDFAIEDSALILRCVPINSEGQISDTLVADGIDYIDINISIWLPDLSAIDISFNETLLVPVYNPQKKLTYVKVTIVNGMAVKRLVTTEYGVWNVPIGYKFDEANVKISYEQILDINALMPL